MCLTTSKVSPSRCTFCTSASLQIRNVTSWISRHIRGVNVSFFQRKALQIFSANMSFAKRLNLIDFLAPEVKNTQHFHAKRAVVNRSGYSYGLRRDFEVSKRDLFLSCWGPCPKCDRSSAVEQLSRYRLPLRAANLAADHMNPSLKNSFAHTAGLHLETLEVLWFSATLLQILGTSRYSCFLRFHRQLPGILVSNQL